MKQHLIAAAAAAAWLFPAAPLTAAVAGFDDLPLAPQSNFFPEATTTFSSGGATFNHVFTNFGGGCCFDSWTYSNRTDTTTPGFTNQFSVIAGGGAAGTPNYGLAYLGAPRVTFAAPTVLAGAYFTNTTYAALSMQTGDSFAKKFGGVSGNDPDFFVLSIIGKSAAGATTGTIDFYLADYRFTDNALDYIVRDWRFVDLSPLGAVNALEFALDSSDKGAFGINTPLYFAMDELAPVPEPATAALLAAGLAGLAGFSWRRQRRRD